MRQRAGHEMASRPGEVVPLGPSKCDHMANGRVEMAVREVKRQCRTLHISAGEQSSVRIADDSPLLSGS